MHKKNLIYVCTKHSVLYAFEVESWEREQLHFSVCVIAFSQVFQNHEFSRSTTEQNRVDKMQIFGLIYNLLWGVRNIKAKAEFTSFCRFGCKFRSRKQNHLYFQFLSICMQPNQSGPCLLSEFTLLYMFQQCRWRNGCLLVIFYQNAVTSFLACRLLGIVFMCFWAYMNCWF